MDLNRYKPVDRSVSAVETAIGAMQADTPAITAAAETARQRRDALLIERDDAALQQAEAGLKTARDDLERLAAVRQALGERLEAAHREEAVERLNERRRELAAAQHEFTRLAREEGQQLVELLRKAIETSNRLDAAGTAVRAQKLAGLTRYPDDAAFASSMPDELDETAAAFAELMAALPGWLPGVSDLSPEPPAPDATDSVTLRQPRRSRIAAVLGGRAA